MRSDHRRVPQSYDEIVRSTVPDPDSSQRPTARQEQAAYEGFRALSDEEEALRARVLDALIGMTSVEVDVDRETVTLRGRVSDVATIARAEELASRVDGVAGVVNRLVVGT
jgi:hypothetical protein